jgi:hypothetical protein
MPLGPSQFVTRSIGCLVLRVNSWRRAEFLGVSPAHASVRPSTLFYPRSRPAALTGQLAPAHSLLPYATNAPEAYPRGTEHTHNLTA